MLYVNTSGLRVQGTQEITVPAAVNMFLLIQFHHIGTKLVTVQQDATYSVYYISVGSSTCFGCWHPSSGARTTVITASGID